MKKKYIATLVAIMLLAGCNTPAPAAPSATDEPDMEAIIQRSVDEAVKEKLEQIEEEQKKKDEEIAKLKEQLEDLTAQSEAPPEENSSAPAENTSSQAPASSQPAAPASSSQPEIPPQPEQEPAPATAKQPAKTGPVNAGTIFEGYEVKVSDWTTPAVSSGGRDWPISTWYFWGPGETVLGSISGKALTAITEKYQVKAAAGGTEAPGGGGDWSTWLAEMFNEYRSVTGGGNVSSGEFSSKEPDEDESGQQAGAFLEDDALEVVRLVNEEREKQGLEPLDVDENLMELARIRAEELEEKFSHERPDGTHAAQVFSGGENIAGDYTSPSAVMEAWMGSEGHRANILRERFHYIGVGCYQDTNGDLYWVQLFSPRKT